jgi:hypothetical protein
MTTNGEEKRARELANRNGSRLDSQPEKSAGLSHDCGATLPWLIAHPAFSARA